MHKLTRPPAPACLAKFRHGRDNWDGVTTEDKKQIWRQLELMQLDRCAYCEDKLSKSRSSKNAHIEHLRQRNRFPQGTFEWANIFGSCNRRTSCGRHKDKQPRYNHHGIVKMDSEDPDSFFVFLPNGTVHPKANLTQREQTRASETIRLFNLNGPLRKVREIEIKGYLQNAEYLAEIAGEYDESEWLPILEEELAKIEELPFVTAIKHILLPVDY